MLIVRRRQGESILIGEDVEIEIIELGPARVKIGINAPAHISVQRKEMAAVRARNVAAAGLGAAARDAIASRFSQEDTSQTPSKSADKTFEAKILRAS